MPKKARREKMLQVFLFFALIMPGLSQETQSEYCMPRLSPLYGPPPVQFLDNRIISIVFKATPEVLQEFVPKPLLPNPYNLMFIYIGRLNIESPVAGRYEYLEAGVVIPVAFSKAPGHYPVCLYLDKALPIVGGREVWGWPKKDAEITFTETDGAISARVERFGTVLLSLSGKLEKKVEPIPSQPEMPWYLLKIIPSVRKNAPPDVWQLISTSFMISWQRDNDFPASPENGSHSPWTQSPLCYNPDECPSFGGERSSNGRF